MKIYSTTIEGKSSSASMVVEDSETYVLDMEDVVVNIDEDGIFDYEDYSFAQSEDKSGRWYGTEYDLELLPDTETMLEYVDTVIGPSLPVEAGKYVINGKVTIVVDVEGIEVVRDYFRDNDDDLVYDEEVYSDNMEVKLNPYLSHADITVVAQK